MSRQFWSETLSWAVADGATFNTTATETIIFPNVTIPANYMADGRVLRLRAFGRYSNVVTAVPTLIFAVRWGGVGGIMLAQSPAIVTSASAVTSAPWMVEVYLQTRSNGATGTIFAMGTASISTGIAPTVGTVANYGVETIMSSTGLTVPAVSAAVDLTADTALSITGKFSASSASNGVTGHMYFIESLN
jgi:hypothetical protein